MFERGAATAGGFQAGFASRHAAAADALQRAFAPPEGFAARDPRTRPVRAEPAGQPRHFTPADRENNPTEGWDMFDPEVEQPAQPFLDPVAAARAAGYAEGVAAAREEAAAALRRDHSLAEQLSLALAQAAHFDRERFAAQLRATVLHLVTRLVGEIGVAPALLAERVETAVDLLADSAESALVRMHPEDVPLVDGLLPKTVFAVGDASLVRGAFVIESASTVVEDGPDRWLEQLAHAIDRVPLPDPC